MSTASRHWADHRVALLTVSAFAGLARGIAGIAKGFLLRQQLGLA